MVTETDLELSDGRTLHVYDTGADDADGARLAVFWHHGTPNIGAPPEPFSRLQPGSASAGCPVTGPDTVDQPPTQAAPWHQLPLALPASPIRWASISSR